MKLIHKVVLPSIALVAGTLFNFPAYAIDTDPLDFIAPHAGVSVLGFYYGDWSSNEQRSQGEKVAGNNIDSNYGVGTYVKFFDISNHVVGAKIIVPVSKLTIETPNGKLSGSGIGDPTLAFPFWLINKPESRTYFALSPRFQIPVGEYDKNKISPGANRYTFTLQAGYTTGLTEKLSIDLVGDAQAFSQNNDIAGGGSLSQKPLYSLQTHLTYEVLPGLNASVGAYKYVGGETETRSIGNNDRTNTTTLIGSVGYWVTKSDNIQLQYRTDTAVENGAKFTGVQLRLLHAF